MAPDAFDIDYPRAVLVALALASGVALIVAGTTSTAAFGAYNPAWDGATALRDEADAAGVESEIARNTTAYTRVPANGTVAVVISPDKPYRSAEAARLRTFVRRGGTLVIAEDFGNHSNALLATLGVRARFDGRLLRDERYNYRSPAMPVARNVSNHSLVSGIERLTLNHGTAVRANRTTVLVRTSGYAYLDTNRNEALDTNESIGAYPVATVERTGAGGVIAVGDPSVLINVMLERPGNRAFVRAVFGTHDRVLLDYSHADRLPPLAVAVLVLRDAPLLQLVLGGIGLLGIGVWTRRPDLVARLRRMGRDEALSVPELDADELASVVRRRHPDWDDERVERVVRNMDRQPENSSRRR